jgi:hypothetical protein
LDLALILSSLWPQLPTIIVNLVGLGIAITRKEKHPKVSLWAGIYFGGSLVLRLLSPLYSLLPVILQDRGLSMISIGTAFTLLNLICLPINTGLGVVLLYAVFGWREDRMDSSNNTPISMGDKNA